MYYPKRIHGEGPHPCAFFFCGSEPGWREDRIGRVFVGPTGEELTRFLDGEKLPKRTDVFLTNLYREYKGKDYIHTADDLARDEQDLQRELEHVQPSLIVPMGRAATRYFLGDVDMDSTHGIAWQWPKDASVTVFPVTHPAAGFHNPEQSSYVAADFAQLAHYLDTGAEPRILFDDPYPEPHYMLLEGDDICLVLQNLS